MCINWTIKCLYLCAILVDEGADMQLTFINSNVFVLKRSSHTYSMNEVKAF